MANVKHIIFNEGEDKGEYLYKIAQKESSLDLNAKNPMPDATASGLFQFTEKTWKDVIKQMDRNYTLADRFDPAKSTQAALYLTQENEKYLEKKLGREVTDTELYIAHVLGAPRASDFITGKEAAPQTPASKYFKREADWNRNVFYNSDNTPKTFAEVGDWFNIDDKKETLEEKKQRARSIRSTTRTIIPEKDESSHLMGYSERDGKYYAHPTLFPKKQREQTYNTDDWVEPEESFELAKERGELFQFDTAEEAARFAAGEWKEDWEENSEESEAPLQQPEEEQAIQDIKNNQFLLALIQSTDAKFRSKGQVRETPIIQ